MRKVFMNGELVDESDAKISIYDSALMFGDMVFEMTRSFNKKQFELRAHIERLFVGLKILRIDIPYTVEQLEEICHQVINANDHLFKDDDEHRLMIDVSRGVLGIYQDIPELSKGPNVIVADFPLRWTVRGMGALFDTGINAVITSQRAIPASLMDPKIKNRSRLFYLMANIEASQFSGENNWALLLDPDGYIAEGTGDNFFIIKGNQVISPEGRNILRGISRDFVANTICPGLGFEFIEKNIEPYDVYTADEAFMTGTPFCMLPVTTLNGVPIGTGKVGNLFNSMLEKWSSEVGINIKQQIQSWNNADGKSALNAPTPYQFSKNKNS
jgi:branched-chain amino acid aminotransferase